MSADAAEASDSFTCSLAQKPLNIASTCCLKYRKHMCSSESFARKSPDTAGKCHDHFTRDF